MRRISLLILACLSLSLLAATAASASPPRHDTPSRFATRILLLEARGQYNRAYRELHPAQQRIISRARYVACLEKNHPRRISSIKVLFASGSTISYQSIPQHEVTRVTVNISYKDGGSSSFSMSAISVAGVYRWVFSPDAAARAASGGCPYS